MTRLEHAVTTLESAERDLLSLAELARQGQLTTEDYDTDITLAYAAIKATQHLADLADEIYEAIDSQEPEANAR